MGLSISPPERNITTTKKRVLSSQSKKLTISDIAQVESDVSKEPSVNNKTDSTIEVYKYERNILESQNKSKDNARAIMPYTDPEDTPPPPPKISVTKPKVRRI